MSDLGPLGPLVSRKKGILILYQSRPVVCPSVHQPVIFLVNASPKLFEVALQTLQVHRSHDVRVLGNVSCDIDLK